LPIDYFLRPVTQLRHRVRLPSDRLKKYLLLGRMDGVPFVDSLTGGFPLCLDVGGGCDENPKNVCYE